MKIHQMSATFGRLDRETLALGPGLNILQSPNETGKSTWCAFLLAMFYGINSRERDRAGSIAEKNRFIPWSGSAMRGRLDCRCADTELTLTRETRRPTAPMGAFRGVYTGTNDEIPRLTGQNCGEALLGVTREVFERSAFIRQAGLPISQDAGLERRIASLITSGEEGTSYSEAADVLKKQLNRRRHNKTGGIPSAEATLEDVRGRLGELDELERRLSDQRREITELEDREAGLTAQLRQYALLDAMQRRKALLRSQEDARVAEQASQALRTQLESARIPENDVIARLRGAIVNLETVRRSVDKARDIRDEALKQQLRAEAAVNESPFAGQSAEAAQRAIHTVPEVHPGFGAPLAVSLLGAAVGAALGWFLLPYGMAAAIGGAIAVIAAAAGIAMRLYHSSRSKARAAALKKQFGTADPQALTALADTYVKLLEAQSSARSGASAASAAAESLYATLSSNEQAILLEVRRFAPSAFDIPTADQLLRECAVRRKELAEAETSARESRLRYELESRQTPDAVSSGDAAPEQPAESREELAAALETVRRSLSDAKSTADHLGGRLAAVGEAASLQAQEEQLSSQIRLMEGEYDAITLALAALDQANTELQRRFSPALGRRAAQIFSQLTDGRYVGVTLDRSFHLAAEPAGDSLYRDAQLLSAGTADQLYLAVRLAICELVLPSNRKIPIILDDALANFDDQRCAAALRWLQKEAQARQILLFTCHSREAQFFRDDPSVRIQELTAAEQWV